MREGGGLNTPWKKNRAPFYSPRERSSNANESFWIIFRPTIRHGSLNNAYANIGSPFRGDGQKIGFFIRSTKANSPFFLFFFFFFVSPHFFLLSFPRQGKNATVGRPHFDFCPLLISKKQRKIERESWLGIEMATTLSRLSLSSDAALADFHSIPAS